MLVLAIDTATPCPAVALAGADGEWWAPLPTGRLASEALLPEISALLASAGTPIGRVDRFAALRGPGSFTGIRVGLATAWGLARTLRRELETVNSLEAVAETARGLGADRVSPAFAAERHESFLGSYWLSAPRAREIAPARIVPTEELPRQAQPGLLVSCGGAPPHPPPALAAARAVRREPRGPDPAPHAEYVRLSAAEEFHGR